MLLRRVVHVTPGELAGGHFEKYGWFMMALLSELINSAGGQGRTVGLIVTFAGDLVCSFALGKMKKRFTLLLVLHGMVQHSLNEICELFIEPYLHSP